ncbi:hypothetical protein P8C59_000291 [Phyllachora maydis]|nr:hypothetical protein P8C59_000291 [Phyllachora maydis]
MTKSHIPIHHSQMQVTVAQNGKKERVFVDLRTVYPTPDEPGTELSFEEVWAATRGWLEQSWDEEQEQEDGREGGAMPADDSQAEPSLVTEENRLPLAHRPLKQSSPAQEMTVHHEVVRLDENGAPMYLKAGKPKKKKVMEVNATQTIKTKLDSPSGPKIKRRQSAEPTMTMHTKAATDEIYDIFNAPLKPSGQADDERGDQDGYETDDYTSGAESTCTTKNLSVSEPGDEEMTDGPVEGPEDVDEEDEEDEVSDGRSVSEWSEFSTRKHIPQVDDEEGSKQRDEHNDTQTSDLIDIQGEQGELDRGQHMMVDGSGRKAQDDDDDGDDGDDELMTTVTEEDYRPRTRTVFIPIPPEDYVPPMRPYRDPAEVANNRLPFMTPITERTETSLGLPSQEEEGEGEGEGDGEGEDEDEDEDEELGVITPSKCDETGVEAGEEDEAKELEPLSSPFRDVLSHDKTPTDKMMAAPSRPKSTAKTAAAGKPGPVPSKGPIIKDARCNPTEDSVRNDILDKMHPPLSSYDGFFDHRHEEFGKGSELRKLVKLAGKSSRNSTDKTGTLATAFVLRFPDTKRRYTIRRELGAGAFAPVYLVENSAPDDDEDGGGDEADSPSAVMGRGAFAMPHQRRSPVEALKMEESPSAWEFHMMRLAHSRVGPHDRAAASLSPALELHLYRDECFLFLPWFPHGTLLDVVNMFRSESAGLMDECLAMFFSIEVLRTAEALHTRGVMHGDLKVDNCLLRVPVPPPPQQQQSHHHHHHHQGRSSLDGGAGGQVPLDSQYHASGEGGWAARGVTLIDFGRAVDVRAFVPEVQFIADWDMSAHDCAEMREGRPWTWQMDYHGIAGIVHCLLFGKYMETVRCDAGGGLGRNVAVGVGGGTGGRRYRIRESLKRYWQTDMWAECFDLLLNPGAFVEAEEGGAMPVLKSMRRVRERMEQWLEANCERGVGLRSLMAKVENWARGRK